MTIHLSISTVVQHLLFIFLLAIAPAWDFWDTQRLKGNPSSAGKLRYYRTLCSWLWIATIVAVSVIGPRPLFTIEPAPQEIPWLLLHAWVFYLVEIVIALFVALMLLPIVIVLRKKLKKQPRKYSSAEAMKHLAYFFPATWTERRWWVLMCITAGICEETLYRGFLLHYLHTFPWALNLTLALLISSVIFGLAHLYGGIGGVIGSAIAGFIFGLLFILTGSLLLPMILHAALDLRMLVILRPPEAATR